MPSHIFTRLGLWDEDIVSNLRSAELARQFEEERHLNALWDQRGHAWDYLVYAYLQTGRDADAKRVVTRVDWVTAEYPVGSLTNAYALAAIPARYALERGRWDEAVRLAVRPAPEWRAAEAITHFARALGAARGGDTALARAEVAALGEIEQALTAAGGPQAYWAGQVKIQRLAAGAWLARAAGDATEAGRPAPAAAGSEDVTQKHPGTPGAVPPAAELLRHLRLAAGAWLARAAGDATEAVRQATAAADIEDVTQKHPVTPGAVLPARELLGDLLLELNRPADAARAYEALLRQAPGRARSLFGLARAAEQAGDMATARARYQEFLKLMEKADGERPELRVAREFLASRD